MQVVRKFRRANQVVDPQPHIDRPAQAQQPRGLAIEPNDFALRAQDDDPVGQRRGGAAQLAIELHQALLVVLLAPMQAYDLRDDVAPDSADIGRIDLRTQPQPAVDAVQIQQLPAQIEAGGA